jgi:hypothetical protein
VGQWKGDYNMALNDEGWYMGAEIGAYVNESANENALRLGVDQNTNRCFSSNVEKMGLCKTNPMKISS